VSENKKAILQFIKSLCLADHMGDVSNDVQDLLDKLGVKGEWEEFSELREVLDEIGIKDSWQEKYKLEL